VAVVHLVARYWLATRWTLAETYESNTLVMMSGDDCDIYRDCLLPPLTLDIAVDLD
jgi:hypothetical protein